MTMRVAGWLGLGVFLLSGVGSLEAQRPDAKAFGDGVICGSQDGRRNECLADTRGGVVLKRQLSQARCDQGRTWDYDARGIWVSGGCRGEFMLGDPGHGRPDGNRPGAGWHPPGGGQFDTVVCESYKKRRNYCPADTRGGVTLVYESSRNNCRAQRTWGWDHGGIWVKGNCKAEFQVPRFVQPQSRRVVCESRRGDYTRCGIGRARSVELVRQLSSSVCKLNYSWGWDRSEIWVNRGCRAEFSVY